MAGGAEQVGASRGAGRQIGTCRTCAAAWLVRDMLTHSPTIHHVQVGLLRAAKRARTTKHRTCAQQLAERQLLKVNDIYCRSQLPQPCNQCGSSRQRVSRDHWRAAAWGGEACTSEPQGSPSAKQQLCVK